MGSYTEYIGEVWPGYAVFPDWLARETQAWWTQAFQNFSESEVDFDGCDDFYFSSYLMIYQIRF